jgi:hypothetical protein
MALEIVWQNPLPLIGIERTLQRISSDQCGAVYAVTAPDLTQEFEVILGEVARVPIQPASLGPMEGSGSDPITIEALYPCWADFLQPNDMPIAEIDISSGGYRQGVDILRLTAPSGELIEVIHH